MSLPVTLPLIDHLALRVRDLRRSRTFYEQALEPFGVKVVESSQGWVRHRGRWRFLDRGRGTPAAPVHVAFAAADRATVDKFHRAAVEAGGRDNGAPGLRPHYHAGITQRSSLTRTGTTSKRSSTGTASYRPRDARLCVLSLEPAFSGYAPKEFTEPVALLSTQPDDVPLRVQPRLSFDLLALRARCVEEPMVESRSRSGIRSADCRTLRSSSGY